MYTGIAAQPFGFPVIVYLALAGTAAGTAIFTSLFALSSHPDWDSIGQALQTEQLVTRLLLR
jgi:hypothetical protein